MRKSLKLAGCALLLAMSTAATASPPADKGSPSLYYRMIWLLDIFGGNAGSCHRYDNCG